MNLNTTKGKYSLLIKTCIILLFGVNNLTGQIIAIPSSEPTKAIIERLMMKVENEKSYHSSHQYFTRAQVLQLIKDLEGNKNLSAKDHEDIQFLVNECKESEQLTSVLYEEKSTSGNRNYLDSTRTFYSPDENDLNKTTPASEENKRPIFGLFYKSPANLIEVNQQDFYIRINPVFNFNIGSSNNNDVGSTTFKNIRGAEIRGGIADRVFFYANIHETQEAYPSYVNEWRGKFGAVPGAGFNKSYTPSFLKNVNGVDYLNSQGVLGFKIIDQIALQFGHGKNFIGDGYRSLFLSDDGANYFYLKLNTKLWIFDYQNIFAELNATGQRGGDELIPKKYIAAHHLSLNLTKWLNVGLFESVVFSRNNNFELQYLNPIIFYRTVEQMVGSPDNAMVGADLKIKLGNSVKLYGQILLDELQIKNIVKQNGWWGNKYGIQAGMQYFDVAGIDHLDMRLEYNLVRPYTYTHTDSSSNYTHHLQPLAHPMGANFSEFLINFRYVPIKNLIVQPHLMYAMIGEDHNGVNNGSQIQLPNTTRTMDFGIPLAQGDKAKILLGGIDISYMLYHNLFADLTLAYRKKDSVLDEYDTKETMFSVGLRMNIAQKKYVF
ncbi:MAG: hypothetical protein IPI15_09115 [Saprospiraceae bacterium]|uniref:capsule assembly Wzi family protein n=1 Tax=Candidatus Brachybacter algidus TaxID=2982024 RepID=UPI0025806D2A|nr:capsule assembly Wzi family protein [Candidatus Brachybacter algidus]MBK7603726.1 hypothetical protein [Candidatus Brachybacter algidus]